MKSKILIVHFRSAMDYPPVYNFARYLADKQVAVTLLTGKRKESSMGLKAKGVNVKEVSIERGNVLVNYAAYFFFYVKTFLELVKTSGVPVIYFESISSPPVFLYFFIFPFSKRTLAIHYHEYFDKEELSRQSLLERVGRKLELRLFRRAIWISQTNKDRLIRFKDEFPWIKNSILRAMPNYPPENWLARKQNVQKKNTRVIKLVYVGSISISGLFLKELKEWLQTLKGEMTCDIYSKYISKDVLTFINSQPNDIIRFKGNLSYDDLPLVLPAYDAGLILYNGISSTNFVYNAPNKLFEYLACDLDVWFSDTLISSRQYETTDSIPKVIKVDFTDLKNFDYRSALNHEGLVYRKSTFVMESVYEEFFKAILIN